MIIIDNKKENNNIDVVFFFPPFMTNLVDIINVINQRGDLC